MSSAPNTIYVIDDDEAARDSLAFLLTSEGYAVSAFSSAKTLIKDLQPAEAGCIVSDIRMPDMSGLDLLRHFNEAGMSIPVLLITGHANVPLAVEAMKAGAFDFVEKPYDGAAIVRSVQQALEQKSSLDAKDQKKTDTLERMASLSMRERQVLDGLVAGHPNKVIAHQLGISPRTVEVYRSHVMTKMRAKSLSGLVRMALLVEPD